jgi:CheY-like chemotaxis protein
MTAHLVPEILVIDDYSTDANLARRAIEECNGTHCKVKVIEDPAEAVRYLRAAASGHRLPALIVMDYRMPMNGGNAISVVRGDPALGHIPILVISAAVGPDELCNVYQLGANVCYSKPIDFTGYKRLFKEVLPHWLSLASLPICTPPRSARSQASTA